MIDIIRKQQQLESAFIASTNVEQPDAAITLTRSSTLAITTAGTTITWQTKVRGQGITWSGTDITIPTAGYYLFNFTYSSSTGHTAFARLFVGGVGAGLFASSYATQVYAVGTHSYTHMRYIEANTIVAVNVTPSANVTINVIAENSANESPYLHIVQLSRGTV